MSTHNRSQRFGGHTKHAHYCSCGKVVHGNGGRRHFEMDGHDRIIHRVWWQVFGRKEGA